MSEIVTDERVERALRAWIKAREHGYVRDWMRAALEGSGLPKMVREADHWQVRAEAAERRLKEAEVLLERCHACVPESLAADIDAFSWSFLEGKSDDSEL